MGMANVHVVVSMSPNACQYNHYMLPRLTGESRLFWISLVGKTLRANGKAVVEVWMRKAGIRW